MYWEQQSFALRFKENGFTPLDLCNQLGKDGRECILEILLINYREETEEFIASLKKFEKMNFKKMRQDILESYTIYEHPKDCPHKYVVRLWHLDKSTDRMSSHDTLEDARMSLPVGLRCVPRFPSDDPVIVEVWYEA